MNDGHALIWNGWTCCSYCWKPFGPERDTADVVPTPSFGMGLNLTHGPVAHAVTGEKYDHVNMTDGGTPLAHVDCYHEWEQTLRAGEGLGAFSGDGDELTGGPGREIAFGDAFDLLAELPENFAHCAVVDYPWEFDASNGAGRFGGHVEGNNVDSLAYEQQPEERIDEVWEHLERVLVPGGWVLTFSDDEFQDRLRRSLKASPLTFRRNWAWTPCHIGMGYYGRINHYPIPVATNGDTQRYVQGRSTLFEIPGGRQTEYPTGKPVDLIEELLEPPVLRDGERLLEPFCGSAPGAVVAEERGCDYWGCDVAEDAHDAVTDRLDDTVIDGGVFDG